MKIKDVMSHPVVSCTTQSTLDQAARLMWEFDCGIVVIVNEKGKPAGVLTDRDICMGAYTQGRTLAEIPVTVAMAHDVISVHGDAVVEQAEALMRRHQLHRLPVMDSEGYAIGMVSMNDLARMAARAKRSGVNREFVSTLAAVCAPRSPAVIEPNGELHRPTVTL